MSRPLIFFLQVLGLFLIFSGASKVPTDYVIIAIGLAAAAAGGIGYRNRNKH